MSVIPRAASASIRRGSRRSASSHSCHSSGVRLGWMPSSASHDDDGIGGERHDGAVGRAAVAVPAHDDRLAPPAAGALLRLLAARSTRSASAALTPRSRRRIAAAWRNSSAERGSRACISDQRGFEDLQPAVQLLVGDRQRRQQPDHVAVQTAAEQQQTLCAGRGDRARDELGRRASSSSRSRTISSASIGPSPRTSPIDSTRVAMSSSAARSRVPSAADGARNAWRRDRLEHHVGRRAGDRVAAEGAAEPARVDRVHDRRRPGDRRQRQPAAERLAGHEQVGLRVVVLDRPHRPGAADAGLDLVVDPQDPVAVAQLAQTSGEVRGHRDEAALALDRLEDHRGDGRRVDVGEEQLLERRDRVVGRHRRGTGTARACGRPRARTARSPSCRA